MMCREGQLATCSYLLRLRINNTGKADFVGVNIKQAGRLRPQRMVQIC